MRHVLITGGGGFIGSAVARALAARGDVAVAFDLHFAAEPKQAGVIQVRGDVCDTAGLFAAVGGHGIDAIIHAAAIVGIAPSVEMPMTVIRVNLEGSVNVFDAARVLGVRRVIHLSSEEVYGAYPTPVVSEDSPTFPTAPYGVTKLATEHLSRSWRSMFGLDIVNMRIPWVYGPRLPRPRMPKLLVDAVVQQRALELEAGGDSRMDHTYVSDVVAGTLAALDHAAHPFDTYNLGSGAAPRIAELVAVMRALVPGARLSVGPGEMTHPGGHAMPRKGQLDIGRAVSVLGYRPAVDIRTGLAMWLDDLGFPRRRRRASTSSLPSPPLNPIGAD